MCVMRVVCLTTILVVISARTLPWDITVLFSPHRHHERPEGCREFLDIAWWSIRRTILEQRTMEISKGSMSRIDGRLGKC